MSAEAVRCPLIVAGDYPARLPMGLAVAAVVAAGPADATVAAGPADDAAVAGRSAATVGLPVAALSAAAAVDAAVPDPAAAFYAALPDAAAG